MRLIVDLLRLLLLIILLPLILLVVGPLLVIAALAGRISLGALQLKPGRYYRSGRIWAFGLGIIIWGLVWGGIAWVWPEFIPRLSSTVTTPAIVQAVLPTATHTPLPATSTATIQPATPTSSPSATPTNIPPTLLPPTATPTATRVVPPASPTPTSQLPSSGAPQPDDPGQTLAEANELLIQYLQTPDPDSQTLLETFWAAEALSEVQTFAGKINLKYQKPLTITYTLIGEPVVTPINNDTVVVHSRELWVYQDARGKKESLSDYDYTLQTQDGRWVIIGYQFRVLPLLTTTAPVTSTEVITSAGNGR